MDEDKSKKPVSLAAARVAKEKDNEKVTPADLLEAIIDDIGQGMFPHIKGIRVIVVEYSPNEDGGHVTEIWGYRCGMKRHEEIGYLAMALAEATDSTR